MEQTKVLIIGASHGGHQSILDLLSRYGDKVDITLFESGDYVSFMSCGMQLYLEGKTTGAENVRNFRPTDFNQPNVHILNNYHAFALSDTEQTISLTNKTTGKVETYQYDKLILSCGVIPTMIKAPGSDLNNIFAMRGPVWAEKIKEKLQDQTVQNVAVIGSGYIGIEAAELFAKAGKHVTLIDQISKPLGTYLDDEMSDIIQNQLTDHGVDLLMGAKVTGFAGVDGDVAAVLTATGQVEADLVIEAVGVTPNTTWLSDVLQLDQRGYIVTNEYLQTNLPNVYAIGDATLTYSIPARKQLPIALATVARREARYIIEHLFEKIPSVPFKGSVGSSALTVFDYKFASTGLNEYVADRNQVVVETSYYQDTLRPSYISEDNPAVYVKLLFDPYTHQILGGAVMSTYDITAQANVLALAIQHKLTLEDLAAADFFFQPGFDRQWSLLNLAAQNALQEMPFTKA